MKSILKYLRINVSKSVILTNPVLVFVYTTRNIQGGTETKTTGLITLTFFDYCYNSKIVRMVFYGVLNINVQQFKQNSSSPWSFRTIS